MDEKRKAPVAERRPHTTHWHNVTLEDPYHWLRDPGYPDVQDPEVLAYLNAENSYFEAFYEPHKALTETIFEELKARQPEEDASVPYTYRGWRYQWRFAKGAQYRVWLRAPEADPTRRTRVPATFSPPSTAPPFHCEAWFERGR